MFEIIHDEQVGKYRLMQLKNGAAPKSKYSHFKIGDEVFPIIPVFDMPGFFAIESTKSHIGQLLDFIWID